MNYPRYILLLKKILLLVIIFNLVAIKLCYAQEEFSNKVSLELLKIATSSKQITKNDYDNFWNSTGVKSQQQKINLINSLKYNFILVQEYNSILWECAEKSWIESKIIKCENLNSNFIKIKQNLLREIGEDDFNKIENKFINIIKIASRRGADEKGHRLTGNASELTLDKIRIAKNDSQKLLDRINIIIQPQFRRN